MTETAKVAKAPKPEYTKEEYIEFSRAKAHKASAPSYVQCVGLSSATCPCKGCTTSRVLTKAAVDWDADKGREAKEALEAELGPKS